MSDPIDIKHLKPVTTVNPEDVIPLYSYSQGQNRKITIADLGAGGGGGSGYSGISGFSGFSGTSGFSGFSGATGTGTSGFSGFSGLVPSLSVVSITSPTELNSVGTEIGELLLVSQIDSMSIDLSTLYRLDETTTPQNLPYVVDSVTSGLSWIAIGGNYNYNNAFYQGLVDAGFINVNNALNGIYMSQSRFVSTLPASNQLDTPSEITSDQIITLTNPSAKTLAVSGGAEFGRTLVATAATSGYSSFRMIPGVTPDILEDGDMWVTPTTAYIRVNDVSIPISSGISGFSGFSGESFGLGYNVMSSEFGAVGTGVSTLLTSGGAQYYNDLFGIYGAQGANAIVAGDEKDWAAIQCALWKAANTGAQIYIPAGTYVVNKPLQELWTATPITGQPGIPKCTKITGDGKYSIIYGTDIASGRGILEFLGENNYQYAANIELSNLTIEADSSCSSGSYCIRAGDAWCGIHFNRINCHGANGISLKVASSLSYSQLATRFTQVNIWTNWNYNWFADEADAAFYAIGHESSGALFDTCGFYDCVFRGLVYLRASIQNYYGCLFTTPSQRPTGVVDFANNVYINLGAANFNGCYFEDHKSAVVCGATLAPITNLTFDGCHFSGVQNFGGPDAEYAIIAFSSVYQCGSISVKNCRFRTVGYTLFCILASGPSYTFENNVDMDDPGNVQITTSTTFARGIKKHLDNSLNYDLITVDNVRPRFPYLDGSVTVEQDVNGEHQFEIKNPSVSGSAYPVFQMNGNGFIGRAIAFGPTYVTPSLRNVWAFFTNGENTAISMGANGAECFRVTGYAGDVRAQFGGNFGDDGSNHTQFNEAIRVEGLCHSFGLVGTNYNLEKDRTRLEVNAACTITVPLGNSWGTSIAGMYEIVNRVSSTGYATIQLSGSDVFDATGTGSITLAPGDTAWIRSNGGSPATWSISKASYRKASVQKFASTSANSFADTVTELGLPGAGVGDIYVASGSITPGKTYKVKANGYADADGGIFTIRVKLGSTTLVSTSTPSLSGMSSAGWNLDTELVCATVGVSGTFFAHGLLTLDGQQYHLTNTSSVTYDTTTSNNLNVTGQWDTQSPGNLWNTQIFRITEEGG